MIVSKALSNSDGSSGVIPDAFSSSLTFFLCLLTSIPMWSLTNRLSTQNLGTEHLFRVSAIFFPHTASLGGSLLCCVGVYVGNFSTQD